ncbi:MAG TPA: phosphoribosylaminoimidazolesuccinocarboxamide synthase [Candidatus Saccharimonadales bacterium]|nr:phosphoribosylaminoimidazolesuccinocarboxamide synthase [Candidatus Saccharimonadales bacterium]
MMRHNEGQSMPVTVGQTNFTLPGQIGEPYRGKVADVYSIEHEVGELLAVVRTDRISAFDVVLPEGIPLKGQVLNQMSVELLAATRAVAPNWLIESPDPNVSLGFKAEPFKVEMIVRGYLLGTSWRGYEAGMRDLCSNQLPDGMREFQAFDAPLVTPNTKAETGHDENITPGQIVESGLATAAVYDEMAHLAAGLFMEGQAAASSRGLVLADTKYEFGRLPTGQIVVIDEVHTPDSSRYYLQSELDVYTSGQTDQRPTQLSKEFVREWLIEQGFSGQEGQRPPHLPEEFQNEVSSRYVTLYQQLLGHEFEPATASSEAARLDTMYQSIAQSLENLRLA